ncbi:selenoprotein F [Ctenocephalides felis]|uniref:selenoprotein F n=1 Tax=Ctenocephalides felis TaxID=7515 RepID=UPI000E6E1C72|nr:selenoprotein F [Ctenocephalides felis]
MWKYIFITIISSLIVTIYAEYSYEDCKALGFNKLDLYCSSCHELDSFGLGIIKDHCLECCNKDDDDLIAPKYPKAVLEVCTCKFGAYPQIQAFIKSDRPSKYPNLQIKYVRGLDPMIKLLDKDGTVKETLSITKWDTDTVEEFLVERLISDEEEYLKTNAL